MKQSAHMNANNVVFVCASCNTRIEVKSTLKDKEISIDVCSNCHPFYIGSAVSQQVKGRAEKFSKKISAMTEQPKAKTEQKAAKKQNKKIVHSLNNL